MSDFAWSYSVLKNFETCSKRYYHYNYAKDVKEPETEEQTRGFELHKNFENRLVRGTPLPLGYAQYEPMLAKIVESPGKVYGEQKLALTREFGPVAFFGKNVWFRTVIDAVKIRDDGIAIVYDWKTGKPKSDDTQLQLMAAALFAHQTSVQRVRAALVFVNHDHIERADYLRTDQAEIWGDVLPRVRLLAQAREKQEYPPKPSGLCKKYCAVVSCPFHGRGG